ncbi:hypothetical protein Pla22_00060 [Rubripirellula amarantea]|uniref:Secreted protein n=1 Tax=Rubripirellula amarantea TaxID=2527999 RepID=A0A5C5WRE1_9BACT|nr:hypothetical protein [Rubripirellula amarantea]TWT52382.1 hypothetical protein Pla22_00060 [Rubripirellula amarantea]
MRNALLVAVLMCLSSGANATDWLTMPSTYSHDPATGTRVSQYAPIQAPSAPIVSNFRTSGYTHTRSTLAYGQSADNYHRVEKWGDPVRPYGEWRFPYRPYSTPYPNWGAPFAGLNLGLGGVYGSPGYGGPGYGTPGYGAPSPSGGSGHHPGASHGHPGAPRNPANGSASQFPLPNQSSPLNPYPAGPGTPYPVAPYYDGYYPPYHD